VQSRAWMSRPIVLAAAPRWRRLDYRPNRHWVGLGFDSGQGSAGLTLILPDEGLRFCVTKHRGGRLANAYSCCDEKQREACPQDTSRNHGLHG
jgi:hypothetical protein